MASFLADIMTYWAGNSTLTNAVPASKFYTGLVPEGTAFPYVIVIPIASTPTNLTAPGYWETFSFQLSVYDSDPDNVETVCQTILGQFDYVSISAACISVERTNVPVFMVDQETPELVYHGMIVYDYRRNQTGQ